VRGVRAWQVQRHGEPRDVLHLVDIDPPIPGRGELRVRVQAAAVGLPDVFMCRSTYAFSPPVPFVPGQEVCGVVEDAGEGVDVAPGTRVMGVTNFFDGRGGFADATIVAANSAYRVPDTMSAIDAAAFRIGFSTAWIGLVRRGGLRAGESLLVLGAAGGSGITAVQLGHALGARVLAVAAGAEKLAFCERMGADVLVDRTTQPPPAADVVYDPVGGELAGAALHAMRQGGRFLAVGFASGAWVQADTHDLVRRNQSLVGVYAGGYTRAENEADHEALLALAADGKLDGFATTTSFDELPAAMTAVAAGRVIGKMVVQVNP
jgi:NADPH2:quinone reductase